jgi:hypothetical protein
MDIELKNQSVVEIGKAVGDNVNSMIPQSQALVPAGATAPAVEPMPMNPFDSMMIVLSEIRDGIYSLVDKFSDSVSLQQDQIQDQAMAQDLAQVSGGEDTAPPEDDAGDDRSFLQKGKDKVSELMGAGGLKGMLIKGGLIFGLLGIAKLMQKYGKEIAEKVAPIVDGIKAFFSVFVDNIGPLFDSAVEMVKTAIGGLLDIFKGLFTGDASTFLSGIKKIFVDFPIQLVSYIGEAFFGLLEAALTAFGFDATYVKDIKEFFRMLPEKISELFAKVGEFFTVTIPEKVTEIKDAIVNFFNDKIVTPIKGLFTDIGTFFTVTVPEKFTEVSNNVTEFFTGIVTSIKGFFTDAVNFVTVTIPEKIAEVSKGIVDKFTEIKDQIIDFAMAPFRKIKELMQNLLVGILESVEGLPFIGDKAKALKEKILGESGGATETLDTAGTGDASIAEAAAMPEPKIVTNEMGDVVNPDTGKKVKFGRNDEESAAQYAAELSKMGQGQFEPYFETKGLNHYAIRKVGESITGAGGTTTGGATGGELNNAGAEFVGTGGNGAGGNLSIMNEGAKVNTVSANQTHMSEDTGTADKKVQDALYDN